MDEIKICGVCKKRIPPREIETGLAVERNGKLLCQECGGPKRPPRDDVVTLLEAILKEVKSINRSLSFEEASVWQLLGGVVQCFVFAALFFAYLSAYLKGGSEGAQTMLQLALLFQLMALTFFTLKR